MCTETIYQTCHDHTGDRGLRPGSRKRQPRQRRRRKLRSFRQHPTNEPANGLLRRRLPKSADLNNGPVRPTLTEDNLNEMPRTLYHWQPAEPVCNNLCRDHY